MPSAPVLPLGTPMVLPWLPEKPVSGLWQLAQLVPAGTESEVSWKSCRPRLWIGVSAGSPRPAGGGTTTGGGGGGGGGVGGGGGGATAPAAEQHKIMIDNEMRIKNAGRAAASMAASDGGCCSMERTPVRQSTGQFPFSLAILARRAP